MNYNVDIFFETIFFAGHFSGQLSYSSAKGLGYIGLGTGLMAFNPKTSSRNTGTTQLFRFFHTVSFMFIYMPCIRKIFAFSILYPTRLSTCLAQNISLFPYYLNISYTHLFTCLAQNISRFSTLYPTCKFRCPVGGSHVLSGFLGSRRI